MILGMRRILATRVCHACIHVRRCFASIPSYRVTDEEHLSAKTISSSPLLPNGNQPLGAPLPCDEHACSVSLPTWSSVVGYEEGDANVVAALATGYPRFVYHPYLVQLMQTVLQLFGDNKTEDCLILPSADAAVRCQAFLQLALENQRDVIDNALIKSTAVDKETDAIIHSESISTTISNGSVKGKSRIRRLTIYDNGGKGNELVHAVIFPAQTTAGTEAKAYWQHTGEVVSSRRAEMALVQILGRKVQKIVTNGPDAPYVYHSAFPEAETSAVLPKSFVDAAKRTKPSIIVGPNCSDSPQDELRERIAGWSQVLDKDHVFLAPSGMASIYTALRSSRRYQMEKWNCKLGGTSIVYGFPYLDTLKLCSRSELCPGGVEFFGRGDQRDAEHLEHLLQKTDRKSVV